ncbi:uncharacterized protein LOC110818629 [Carica papaya]|uniref:uncharacterized protein LOC110818629 n=1 Tax=Carica papaya TaxID=3649 RepID=UPI000B8CB932|nr:uncharacterized protein LOC110818629 [Carica papaya]
MSLITKSISTTKSLFHKTIQTFKSFFPSADHHHYIRLPKITTPSFNAFCCGTHMDDDPVKIKSNGQGQRLPEKKPSGSPEKKKEYYPEEKREEQAGSRSVNGDDDRGRRCLVLQKLRELKMIWRSDVDYVLDIEEVLHYYSRLTCPAYLDIIDKFFMEIYPEFFRLQQPLTPTTINCSKPTSLVRSYA